MAKYRKKPIVIEAVQWDGTPATLVEIIKLSVAGGRPVDCAIPLRPKTPLIIATLEGEMKASPGDWIIKGISGELYPCKPEIFAETYELVEEKDDG